MDGERLDKWLWVARFYKSRTLATAACGGGKVDVNEQAAKPARFVRPGDLRHITRRDDRRIVRIVALAVRRGNRADAPLPGPDLTPPPPPPRQRGAPSPY